jgi:hypothetical protein
MGAMAVRDIGSGSVIFLIDENVMCKNRDSNAEMHPV